MTGRWQQGTNDQDGDGHKGGSITAAEAARRAQAQEDKTMAKKPTTTETAPAKKDAAAAPSQPWAKPAASEDSAKATTPASDAPAPASDAQNPTPTATSDSSPNRTDAEAKDQVTPVGEDLSSTLHAQFTDLDDDERAEFEAFMNEQAKLKLAQLTKGREARAMEVGLVDGSAHYGKKVPATRAKQLEA